MAWHLKTIENNSPIIATDRVASVSRRSTSDNRRMHSLSQVKSVDNINLRLGDHASTEREPGTDDKRVSGYRRTVCLLHGRQTDIRAGVAAPRSASRLNRADSLAWGNRWTDAQPLYEKAQHLFAAQKQPSKALYAQVSQIPPDESGSIRGKIVQLTEDLRRPEAEDAETKLRIFTIRGMLETNCDAAQARSTWEEGAQGIAAFISGDLERAKSR